MKSYDDAELARVYQPGERILFGAFVMNVEGADRLHGLVQRDRQTGTYKRVCMDPATEAGIITRATAASRVPHPPRPLGNTLRR